MRFLNTIISKEKKNKLHEMRPPFLWNKPETLNQEHFLRFSSDLPINYSDTDVLELYRLIEKFSSVLISYNKDKWDKMLKLILNIFE